MTPRANLTLVTSAKPSPQPTGARTYFDPRTAAELETVGKNIAAIARSLAGRTTDVAIKSASDRLLNYIGELATIREAIR